MIFHLKRNTGASHDPPSCGATCVKGKKLEGEREGEERERRVKGERRGKEREGEGGKIRV